MDPDSYGDAGLGLADAEALMIAGSTNKSALFVNKPMGDPKRGPKTMQKPTNAPKRFKSSFIFFSMAKHKQIKEHLVKQGDTAKTTNITKMVSDAWRNMGTEERTKYDALAQEDKARYEVEKANYKEEKGATTKKKQRDPDAPKRPMSAFLAFANSRRGEVKAQNRECSNGEISKLLSNMWKEFPDEPKQKYRDDEAALWAIYKEGMVEWRKKNDGRKKASKALLADSRKKRKKKSKDDEQPSVNESAFDDHQLSGLGGHGLGGHSLGYDPAGNPNQDEMMAASALRGVRGGPNFPLGQGAGPGMGGNPAGVGFDGGMAQQAQLQQGAGGYGSLFAMNSMSAGNPYGSGVASAAGNPAAAGGFGQDMGNTTNRALLEMGFPYQQYGGYPLGNSQAMLMAQALRGAPASYHNQLLGFSDQQPPLSQLASLAGTQNGGSGAQAPVPGMGMGMGMGAFMNDNSGGSMNRMSMGDGGLNNGLPGAERF